MAPIPRLASVCRRPRPQYAYASLINLTRTSVTLLHRTRTRLTRYVLFVELRYELAGRDSRRAPAMRHASGCRIQSREADHTSSGPPSAPTRSPARPATRA